MSPGCRDFRELLRWLYAGDVATESALLLDRVIKSAFAINQADVKARASATGFAKLCADLDAGVGLARIDADRGACKDPTGEA